MPSQLVLQLLDVDGSVAPAAVEERLEHAVATMTCRVLFSSPAATANAMLLSFSLLLLAPLPNVLVHRDGGTLHFGQPNKPEVLKVLVSKLSTYVSE